MNDRTGFELDKRLVRRSFERAAVSYDQAAVLQREVDSRMQERLDFVRLDPDIVLDAGAGTGRASQVLLQRYRRSRVIALDAAANMLRQMPATRWRRGAERLCADAEFLPLSGGSVDLVYSNMLLPWLASPAAAFGEFRRVLRAQGLFMFSSLGPDTLMELRAAWAEVDDGAHVHAFIDMHDVGDALLQAGFADPVMDAERITLTYRDVDTLLRDLREQGAVNRLRDRRRGLTGKQCMKRMRKALEQQRGADGLLNVTCEVIYGHAWAAERTTAGSAPVAAESRVPLAELGGRRRKE